MESPAVDSAPGSGLRRVVIADDHELLREGTRRILEESGACTVVGEAADGAGAIRLAREVRPDAVILDIRLPDMNGLEVARRLRELPARMAIVMVTAYDDADYVRAALAIGVDAYVLKTAPAESLLEAVEAACSGRRSVDPALLARHLSGTPAESPARRRLTPREADVLRLVATGMPNKAIGRELGISPRTVEVHLNHVYEKLGVTSRTELVNVAITSGMIEATR